MQRRRAGNFKARRRLGGRNDFLADRGAQAITYKEVIIPRAVLRQVKRQPCKVLRAALNFLACLYFFIFLCQIILRPSKNYFYCDFRFSAATSSDCIKRFSPCNQHVSNLFALCPCLARPALLVLIFPFFYIQPCLQQRPCKNLKTVETKRAGRNWPNLLFGDKSNIISPCETSGLFL